jgi:hypothetical protein
MLASLLASLLASGSFDNVLIDSAATPPSPVSPTQQPARVSSPLEKNSWGLGFRLFGEAPELMIHGALGTHTSVSLQAFLRESSFNPKPASPTLRGESSSFELQIAVPLRTRFACRGSLCATASLGPMLQVLHREASSSYFAGTEPVHESADRTEIRGGLSGALGAALEIFPRVHLATEMGLKGWFLGGDASESTNYPENSPYGDSHRTNDLEGQEIASWFGGIGLDFWF